MLKIQSCKVENLSVDSLTYDIQKLKLTSYLLS